MPSHFAHPGNHRPLPIDAAAARQDDGSCQGGQRRDVMKQEQSRAQARQRAAPRSPRPNKTWRASLASPAPAALSERRKRRCDDQEEREPLRPAAVFLFAAPVDELSSILGYGRLIKRRPAEGFENEHTFYVSACGVGVVGSDASYAASGIPFQAGGTAQNPLPRSMRCMSSVGGCRARGAMSGGFRCE